jgi:hypothetical protein
MISDFPDFGATPWVKGIAGGMANIRHSLSWGAQMRARRSRSVIPASRMRIPRRSRWAG